MKEVERTYLRVDMSHKDIFGALSSDTRLKILELIQNKKLAIQEIGQALNMSSAGVTKHINILEKAGIIRTYSEKGIRGRLRMCELDVYEMVLIFNNNYDEEGINSVEKRIPIGSFVDFSVSAPCGMAAADGIIGYIDHPGVFYHPEKEAIQHLWFTSGYITYNLPTYDVKVDEVKAIEITFEMSSEYPGYNNHFKSDITYALNGLELGTWTAPGDYGDRKGNYTPTWWELGSEYGDLVTLKLTDKGTFFNGIKAGTLTLEDVLAVQTDALSFTIASPTDVENPGGLNLFGETFGDYAQHIVVKYIYEE